MESNDIKVPRSLDELPRLLFFDYVQIVLILLMFGIGNACDFVGAGLISGLFMAYIYGKLQAGRHPRYLLHLAYWYLPERIVPLNSMPPSYLRFFVG